MEYTDSENVKVGSSLQTPLIQPLEFPEELSEASSSLKMTSGKDSAGDTGSNPLNFWFAVVYFHSSIPKVQRQQQNKPAMEQKPRDSVVCLLSARPLKSHSMRKQEDIFKAQIRSCQALLETRLWLHCDLIKTHSSTCGSCLGAWGPRAHEGTRSLLRVKMSPSFCNS